MYKQLRQNRIREILSGRKQISVQELSSILNVSVVTVRGDLNDLETEGFLTRTHGGAFVNENGCSDAQIQKFIAGPEIDYNKRKEIIGNISANLIEGDEWVFLGSGTTAYYVARALQNVSPLNILTNNLLAAYELTKNPLANVLMTGGSLLHSTYNLGGEIFELTLHPITISKAFISLIGVDLDSAYTVSTPGELNVFKTIRSISKKVFIIVDSSKFDKSGFIKVGELPDADAIITDALPPQKYYDYYKQRGIPIYTPDTVNIS
ncbi:MAG: DeoR/GlpR family DNA-binding transcription regulator [Lachnospiraceae bacterium]|nr:DeoR/GlpR family DNA-binding transcription regulator [Lachnospiraceae bacterium]